MLLLIWLSPMKIAKEALRFSAKKDGKRLLQSTVIALLIVAALLGFRFYMNAKNPAYREIPLFGLYLNVHTRWLYPVSIVFQEFFIKAFTQENIGIALQGIGADGNQYESNRAQTVLSSLITAMFFFVLHIQFPLYYMTGAFLLCFFTGLLYERDRNIWGPVMIHFAIGFLPRCFGILQIIEG
jgi:membrane protease YdiL (CAAX protease family)